MTEVCYEPCAFSYSCERSYINNKDGETIYTPSLYEDRDRNTTPHCYEPK